MLLCLAGSAVAWGQQPQQIPAEPEPTPVKIDPAPEDSAPAGKGGGAVLEIPEEPTAAIPIAEDKRPTGSTTLSERAYWKDIVVIPRKSFLKGGRFEVAPYWGFTVNDALIKHQTFGGEANYFITDALSVGIEGNLYIKDITDTVARVQVQDRRIPTLNKYIFGGHLNFGYVPVYGKFAVFNRWITHWELFVSAGVGMVKSQIIPRDPRNQPFESYNVAANLGVGARLFLNDWLALNVAIRDYIFRDQFESTSRPSGQSAADAKANADPAFINNVVFHVGLSIFLPTRFKYTSLR